jgi:HK97 family phage prohead protease
MTRLIKVERHFTVTKSLNEEGIFEGYASTFNEEDNHGETVLKGAFKKGLAKYAREKRRVKLLWQHDRHSPIGVVKEAHEDDTGLYFRGKLTRGVQKADEAHLLMQDEAIDSVSIGAYVILADEDRKTFKVKYKELELREISPVTFPALDSARITSVKSLEAVSDLAALEAHLREVGGFSHNEAKLIIAKAKGVTGQREVERTASINNLLSTLRSINQS